MSPVRREIIKELNSRIETTEEFLSILYDIRGTVATAETYSDLELCMYRLYKRKDISEETLKGWIKYLDQTIGQELIQRERGE